MRETSTKTALQYEGNAVEMMENFKMNERVVLKSLARAIKKKVDFERKTANTMVQFDDFKVYLFPDSDNGYSTHEERLKFNQWAVRMEKSQYAILHKLIDLGYIRKSVINKRYRKNGTYKTAYYGFTEQGKKYLKSLVNKK